MFGIKSESKAEKLPTLAQFCKSTKEPVKPKLYPVDLIWFPGTFDNFTLQTEQFRVIVSPRSNLYQHLVGFKNDEQSAETPIFISICDWKKAQFVLETKERRGAWTFVAGESGVRWNIA